MIWSEHLKHEMRTTRARDAPNKLCLVLCVRTATNVSVFRKIFTGLHIGAWGRLPLRPQAEGALPFVAGKRGVHSLKLNELASEWFTMGPPEQSSNTIATFILDSSSGLQFLRASTQAN
jgi:hypothetical protein